MDILDWSQVHLPSGQDVLGCSCHDSSQVDRNFSPLPTRCSCCSVGPAVFDPAFYSDESSEMETSVAALLSCGTENRCFPLSAGSEALNTAEWQQQGYASTFSTSSSISTLACTSPLTTTSCTICAPFSNNCIGSSGSCTSWRPHAFPSQQHDAPWETPCMLTDDRMFLTDQQWLSPESPIHYNGFTNSAPSESEPHFKESSTRLLAALPHPQTVPYAPVAASNDGTQVVPCQTPESHLVPENLQNQGSDFAHLSFSTPPADPQPSPKQPSLPHQRKRTSRTSPSSLTCPICTRIFRKRSNLRIHMRDHDGNFECSACHQVFTERCNLVSHAKVHQGPFPCETCGKVFKKRANLTTHEKIHDGNQNFVECLIHGCSKKYKRGGDLNRHIKSVSNPCLR